MDLSEQDEKRLQELVIELEVVNDKIWDILRPLKEENRVVLSQEQMKELKDLFDQEDRLTKEFMSIPNIYKQESA